VRKLDRLDLHEIRQWRAGGRYARSWETIGLGSCGWQGVVTTVVTQGVAKSGAGRVVELRGAALAWSRASTGARGGPAVGSAPPGAARTPTVRITASEIAVGRPVGLVLELPSPGLGTQRRLHRWRLASVPQWCRRAIWKHEAKSRCPTQVKSVVQVPKIKVSACWTHPFR
jgi:hypothetical protein